MTALAAATLDLSSDVTLDGIQPERVRDDEALFYLLCSASLVETASALFTRNLVEHIDGDEQVARWLDEHWAGDERRHGQFLRDYVATVWPDFAWERAFASFYAEYSDRYRLEELDASQALTMATRCVSESGTASLYRAIHNHTDEPALKALTWRIYRDDMRHYRHFLRYFRRFNASERNGRGSVALALTRGLLEARREDAEVAIRHVMLTHEPGEATLTRCEAISRRVRDLVTAQLPPMISPSLLRPLTLSPRWRRRLQRPLNSVARFLLLH